ncbi:MAG: hypothetical protein P4L76_16045 [Beijerinckiaceae bacterium]|nr:hypothetical protein [Beijerinckiaceae bacterium]
MPLPWRKILTVLLRLLLIAAFVPVLLDLLTVFPALAARAVSAPGLSATMILFAAGPPVAGFFVVAILAWAGLRLWHTERWRALGFCVGLFAFLAVWSAALG